MIKFKKYLENRKGFTLIETIVSIALIAIISIAFLTMFTNSMVGIIGAGKKSGYHYTAQDQMESNINDSSILPSNVASTDTTISLSFDGNVYTVSGRKVDVTYTYGNILKKLTSFTTK